MDPLAVDEDGVGEGPAHVDAQEHGVKLAELRASGPGLESGAAVRPEHDVDAVELVVEVGEVGAQVAAAGLLALQGAGGDRRGERIGVGAQLLEPVGVADRAGEAPDRVAGLQRRGLEAP